MNCLEDWIGIEGCASAPSNSGYYINSLAGISQAQMSQIANSEQSTFVGVWEDIQSRALLRFKSDFNNYMRLRYRKSDSVTGFSINKLNINTGTTIAANPDAMGVLFGTDPYASPLLAQHIQSVRFYIAAVNGDIDIDIWNVTEDLIATEILDTFTIAAADLVVGWNTKYINTTYYDSINLFIGFDHTNYAAPTLTIDSDYYSSNSGYLKGARFDNSGELVTGLNSFGIAVTCSLQCRYEAYVCDNLDLFTNAIMQLYGAELMRERIHTDQINVYTTVNLDKAKLLFDQYEAAYKSEMQNVVEGIYLDCDQCVECNSLTQISNNLP